VKAAFFFHLTNPPIIYGDEPDRPFILLAILEGASLFGDRSLGLMRAIGFRPEKFCFYLPFLMRAITSLFLCPLFV
jgi:hypothetical protein